MENANYQALELHKILQMLSAKCTVPKAKELALEIEPQTDLDTVKEEMAKTSQTFELTVRYGTPGFYKVQDISAEGGSGRYTFNKRAY